jgi:hypothetical protein
MHDMMAMEASGNLQGHVGPGLAYLLWACIWLVLLRADPGPDGVVTPLERVPLVSWAKIIALPIGFAFEVPRSTWSPMSFAMGWQHITIYVPVALSGVVDLFARRGRLSPHATHGAYALAFAIGAIVMFGHGNPVGVEGMAHLLLAVLYSSCALAALVRLAWPSGRTRLLHAAAQLALGLWYIVAGVVLFLSGWNLGDPTRVMWVVTLFALTLTTAAAVLVVASVGPAAPAVDAGLHRDDAERAAAEVARVG